jgi:pyrroline-5-carboxylate reductase
MKISFIGGGNMAEAMLSAILSKGLSAPEDVSVSDVNQMRLDHLKQKYGIRITMSNLEALGRGGVIILAVKPQNLAGVMAEVSGRLKTPQLVLSIIAGKSIDTLRQGLKYDAIVRAMPNTPAQIGQGMTVWTAAPEVNKSQNAQAGAILGAMGKEIYVEDEKYIDMATAISGSGPAYVFLFMECLIKAAVDIGLPQDVARELVFQTVVGACNFAQKSGRELGELRRMVTSPGGTTAEAIKVLEEGGFAELVKQAVAAAYDKAQQIGG